LGDVNSESLLLISFVTSCSTPYQPMSVIGGYEEKQLAADIYRVAFFAISGCLRSGGNAQASTNPLKRREQQPTILFSALMAFWCSPAISLIFFPGRYY
jgi:hypothetical protein